MACSGQVTALHWLPDLQGPAAELDLGLSPNELSHSPPIFTNSSVFAVVLCVADGRMVWDEVG